VSQHPSPHRGHPEPLGRCPDEDHLGGVDQVHQVGDEVEDGEEGDPQALVPPTVPAAGVGALHTIEAVEGPNDGGGDVHHQGQGIVAHQHLLQRAGHVGEAPANGEDNDEEGDDEANRVDSHTPLQAGFRTVVIQQGEDETSHIGFKDLEEPRHGGEEAADVPWLGAGEPHLEGVGEEAEAGDGGGHSLPGTLAAAAGTADEGGGEDYRGGKDHQRRQHGES